VIITAKLPCDIKEINSGNYHENLENLKGHLSRLMESIIHSNSDVSNRMKYLFYYLRITAEAKFGKIAGITGVTGFLFLRFLVPAIRDPQIYGIWLGEIEQEDKQTLHSLAQLIQKIANLSAKFKEDDHFAPFNDYISEITEPLIQFIDEITRNDEENSPIRQRGIDVNSLIAYDAACLVYYFNLHKDYYKNNSEDDNVQLIQTILNPINKAYGCNIFNN
jgi:hypothetical protein